MENYTLDARYHLGLANTIKETSTATRDCAQVEATIALAYAVLAVVERIDALTDAVDLPLDNQGRLSVGVNKI